VYTDGVYLSEGEGGVGIVLSEGEGAVSYFSLRMRASYVRRRYPPYI
jgi:hypothetical protein